MEPLDRSTIASELSRLRKCDDREGMKALVAETMITHNVSSIHYEGLRFVKGYDGTVKIKGIAPNVPYKNDQSKTTRSGKTY